MVARLYRNLCIVLLTVLSLTGVPVGASYAATPQIVRVEPTLHDGNLEINADLNFDLNGQLLEAARRGVALYFTADLSISAPRWWWFDRTVLTTSRTWRVAYNALTRQWQIGSGEDAWLAGSLEEAMEEVRHIRGWQLSDASQFEPDINYKGTLRLRLDTSQLARPLRVNALNSSAWMVETPWTNFSFMIAEARLVP